MNLALTVNRLPVLVVLVGVVASLGFNPASTAVQKVREGIQFFVGGDFESAGNSFNEADKAEPDNATIAFNRACALAASGDSAKVEEAQKLFRNAALVRDIRIAARALYNLGCVSAEQGRATLGEDPVEAAPEHREAGVSQLLAAVGYYRDCLRLDKEHVEARHNLELIRLFIKHIQDQWAKRDRELARAEKGLLEFLAMIEQRQTELRSAVRSLSEQKDSPQRRQATSELADSQKELHDEIEPLKDKITEEITAAQQTPPGGNARNADPNLAIQMKQAQKVLHQLTDEAGSKMAEAASELATAAFEDARTNQLNSLDRLNEIFMAMAPFQNVLQRATKQQEQLTGHSENWTGYEPDPVVEETPDDDDAADADDKREQPPGGIDLPDHEYPEVALQQSRVADWSRMLSLKAQADLPQIEAQLKAVQKKTADTEDPTPQSTISDNKDESTEEDAEAELKSEAEDRLVHLQGLKASLEKAIELGPTVEEHSRTASESLEAKQLVAALPDQQEALKLLREIAESLSRDDQQQQGDDQKNDDQKKKDAKKNDQDHKSNSDQPDKSEQQKQQEQQQTGQSQRERAMSALRRAREREREHRDLRKQLQQLIGGQIRVDRDW
jgi:hypothetical protein